MSGPLPFGSNHRDGEGFRPRHCVICFELITEVAAPNQSAHPGDCRAEQKRRYLAKVAQENKKKRDAAKVKHSKVEGNR